MADDADEILVVMERGKVVRSLVGQIPVHGRDSTGVILAKPDAGDRILAVARNVERRLGTDAATVDGDSPDDVLDETALDDEVGSASGADDSAGTDGDSTDSGGSDAAAGTTAADEDDR